MALAAVLISGCGSSSSKSSSTASASTPASSSAPAATTPATAPASAGGQTLHVSADPSKLAFNTTTLTAKAGKVTIVMANPAAISHGISVQGNGVDKDGPVVGMGATSTITATLKPGKYTFYCPVPGHRTAGMMGTLTVT
jgi:uncharacterized cupredoxin-like copper-binding protein